MPAKSYKVIDLQNGVFTADILSFSEEYSISLANRESLDEFKRLMYDMGFVYMGGKES